MRTYATITFLLLAASLQGIGGKAGIGGKSGFGGGATAVATPALVSNVAGQGAGTFTTSSINTTGANYIGVAVIDYQGAAAAVLSDTQGGLSNTYTALTRYCASGQSCTTIYYNCSPAHVGAGHTFTLTGSNIFAGLDVMAFSGIATSSCFQTGTDSGAVGGGAQPGSITPSGSSVVITAFGSGPGTTFAVDSGFTIADQWAYNGSVSFGGAGAYFIQPSGGAVNPTWSNGSTPVTSIAAFKGQ